MIISITEYLNERQHKVISDLLNTGIEHSSTSLSTMINDEVKLTCSVQFLTTDELNMMIHNQTGNHINCIRQSFTGKFRGDSYFFSPEEDSLLLVRELLHEDINMDDLTDMEENVLSEVGNIILNSCLASFCNVLSLDIDTELPVFEKQKVDQFFYQSVSGNPHEDTAILLGYLDFSMPSKSFNGYIMLSLDMSSNERLTEYVDNFISTI